MASLDCLPSGSYRVRWRVTNRITKQVSSGARSFGKFADAKDFHKTIVQREKSIRSGSTVSPVVTAAKARWISSLSRYSSCTSGHYSKTTDRFFASLPSGIDLIEDVTTSHIITYLESLKGVLFGTINSHLIAIKSMCRYFSKVYSIPNIATDVHFFKQEPPDQRFIIEDEYKAILSVIDDCEYQRLVLIAHTGLRASELCGLRWNRPVKLTEHCGWPNKELTSLSVIGKGRKLRTIPLNQTARTILESLRSQSSDYIYLSKSRRKSKTSHLMREGLYLTCARVAKKAKITAFGPHALRHYFATTLLLSGTNLYQVSRILGHSSVKTTEQVYIHVLDSQYLGITDILES